MLACHAMLCPSRAFLIAKGDSVQCEGIIECPKHGLPMAVICLDGRCLLRVSSWEQVVDVRVSLPVGEQGR